MKKIVGVCGTLKMELAADKMKEAGVEYVRKGTGFPFADEKMTTLSEEYKKNREGIKYLVDNGIKVVASTPMYGQMESDPEKKGEFTFKSRMPAWMGSHEDKAFYSKLTEAMTFVGEDLKDLASVYQIANEMDVAPRFRGTMSVDDAIRFLNASCKGIKLGNPNAKTGINPALLEEHAGKRMLEVTSSPSNEVKYDFGGIDGYFASYHPGKPEDWIGLIDRVYEITHLPVLVYEWGYSSIGKLIPESEWPEGHHPNGDPWTCALGAWKYAYKGAHTEEVQADYISTVMKIFAESPKVAGCLYYQWSDNPRCFCGRESCPHECGFGLLDRDGNTKRSFYAFQKAVRELF